MNRPKSGIRLCVSFKATVEKDAMPYEDNIEMLILCASEDIGKHVCASYT